MNVIPTPVAFAAAIAISLVVGLVVGFLFGAIAMMLFVSKVLAKHGLTLTDGRLVRVTYQSMPDVMWDRLFPPKPE